MRSFLDDGPADVEHLGCDTAKPLTASKMHQLGIEPGQRCILAGAGAVAVFEASTMRYLPDQEPNAHEAGPARI